MKLLICGSRSIKEFDPAPYIPQDCELIIAGGAKGVDTLAEKYADSHGIPKEIVLPDYAKYGRYAAPRKRNIIMVDMADAVLAIWDGKSTGTKYTIEYAKKQKKPITIIMVESEQ